MRIAPGETEQQAPKTGHKEQLKDLKQAAKDAGMVDSRCTRAGYKNRSKGQCEIVVHCH